jgi:hypothetical protein
LFASPVATVTYTSSYYRLRKNSYPIAPNDRRINLHCLLIIGTVVTYSRPVIARLVLCSPGFGASNPASGPFTSTGEVATDNDRA